MRENHRENNRENNRGKPSENYRKTVVVYQTNGVRDAHEEKSMKRRSGANEGGEVDPMKEEEKG